MLRLTLPVSLLLTLLLLLHHPAAQSATNYRIYVPSVNRISGEEWIWHRTADGAHPSGREQQMLWLMNRARANPAAEGRWLATVTDEDVALPRAYFGVDTALLQQEFAAYPNQAPAAFDVRLYTAALDHSQDLLRRNAQDYRGQFERIRRAGFTYTIAAGNVFAYAQSPLNAHAAFTIDWGLEPGGMQSGRGHRNAVLSLDAEYTNAGIAVEPGRNGGKLGPWVITANYARAASLPNQYNRFLVGTIWTDKNRNARYDPGEGIGGVVVAPNGAPFYAITAAGGGYALPLPAAGTYAVSFINPQIQTVQQIQVGQTSTLLDLVIP